MAKTRIVTPNTGSKGKKSCQTEAVGSSLDRTLTNYVNWDWFVSKLWRDQLWQTTFAGDLAVWRPHGVPTRSPVTTLLLWVHTVEDDLQEIVSFSQSAAVWLCQQVQFDSKCFPLSNRPSIVLFTDGGSVTSERSTFWGLGRRTIGERERERERRKWRHHVARLSLHFPLPKFALGYEFTLSLAENSHFSILPSHFPSHPS